MSPEPSAASPLAVGDSMLRTFTLAPEEVARFAALAGDPNPLHRDAAAASASRFGVLIASGAHLAAMLTGACAEFTLAHGPGLGLEFSYRFRRAARVGVRLHLRWEVVSVAPHAKLGGDVLSLAAELREDTGELVVSGTGKVLMAAAARVDPEAL